MRNLKVVFNLVAFVVGITGAVASQMLMPSPGYLYETPGGVPTCREVIQCSNAGSTCQFSGIDVGDTNNPSSTTCGSTLLHTP